MKQILEKPVFVLNTTHTLWRAITCCLIMAMVMFGSLGIAKAQSITIDAPSTVYNNALVSISLNTNCVVSSVNWDLQGGTIVNSYDNGASIDVRFATTGYKYIQATAIISCSPNYQQQLLSTSANINVVQAPIPPVVISGFVTTTCGTGVPDATISFIGTGSSSGQNFSATTDNDGFYSVIVPYAYSSSVAANKSNYSFSPSQNFTNTTANRTLNFSVVQGNNGGSSLALAWDGNFITIVGMVPGFQYVLLRTNRATGAVFSYEVDTTYITHMISRLDYSQVCIRLKCGTQTPTCIN
jgi:hypothetical protein